LKSPACSNRWRPFMNRPRDHLTRPFHAMSEPREQPARRTMTGADRPVPEPTRSSCSGFVAGEFTCRKDEDIHGDGEPCDYVHQVARGAVRTCNRMGAAG
jgi:hypothetical protein